jgi:hypothetical protein
MSNYFTLKNRTILNPPTGTDLGSGNNKFANVYIGNQLTVGTTTVDSTSIGSIKIAGVTYPGDDTAADTAGGQTLTITGSGFISGASVIIDGATVSVVSVVSGTQITFVAPAKAAGSYSLYVINPDGATAISIVGIQFSGVPTWTTVAGSLSTVYEGDAVNTQLAATGDAPVIYSLASGSLPGGLTLYGNGRVLGTANTLVSSTTYNFTAKATDYQNQDTNRSFSYTVNPELVTFNTPASDQSYGNSTGSSFSLTLNATSAAGRGITYTANSLPTGLSLSGANITGTLSSAGSTSSLVTATAAGTGKTATRTLTWAVTSPTLTVNYLVVAGGGGGTGTAQGGAGGGGGFRTSAGTSGRGSAAESAATATRGNTYTITVGAGGGGGINDYGGGNASNGGDSAFGSIVSLGGGGSGPAGGISAPGLSGGCGGGAAMNNNGGNSGGSGTAGQGYDGSGTGGGGGNAFGSNRGGGGGAGSAGSNQNGGSGQSSAISGSSVTYAGGGGANYRDGSGNMLAGSGGSGGGANSAPFWGNAPAAPANLGGGGGSGNQPSSADNGKGSNGGSGVVILRFADTESAAASTTGSPTITVAGGYRVYKWTSSGSITF